jgi:hypothetical protein
VKSTHASNDLVFIDIGLVADRQVTPRNALDFAIGIALPLVCLYIDPVLFRGDIIPVLPSFAVFAYVLIALCMGSLLIRLALPHERGAFLSGVLAAGALVAFLLGLVVLLPLVALAVIAIFRFSPGALFVFGIGIFDVIPFLISVVYFRAAYSALPDAERSIAARTGWPAIAGFLFPLAVAALAQFGIDSELDRIATAAIEGKPVSLRELAVVGSLAWGNELDRLVENYVAETDTDRRGRLAVVYWQLAKRNVEDRIAERSMD